MKYAITLGLLTILLFAGCESTSERDDGLVDGQTIDIPASDMEPAAEFINRTKRVIIAEFVRVDMSAQLYESQLGMSRDIESIKRTDATLEDGTIVVSLKRVDDGQRTNLNPDRLPRLYFGTGLEARAYNELRIYIRRRVEKDRPIFLKITGVSKSDDTRLWVGGRLQKEKPRLVIESSMMWSDKFEHYKHKSAIY
jgi:hypothetical protein